MNNNNVNAPQIGWNFDNSYNKLPQQILSKLVPEKVDRPQVVILNNKLSDTLGLNFSKLKENDVANLLSGNIMPKGSSSIAQAYSGHQYGHFTKLGDGRAILVGESHFQNTI